MSWRSLFFSLLVASNASAEPSRFVVAIGSNVGDPEDVPLQFAQDDARRFASLFVELGGVASGQSVMLFDQPAPVVEASLRDLSAHIARTVAGGDAAVLYVYVSAHAKAGVLHLAGTHLPIDRLRALTETAAQLEIVVVDSCDSGAGVAMKGGAPGPAFAIDLMPDGPKGQVFISSSGPSEPAQEWLSLRGSLFTHHLLAGLRGDADADGDGQVTLSEGYGYARRRTLVGSTLAGQHPTFSLELEGTNDVVLTEPGRGRSALVFPAPMEGRFVVASLPRPDVVVELDKQAGRSARLAVPPGRYRVLKRLGRLVGLVDVELPWGGEQIVEEGGMLRRAHTEVATKGSFELRPLAVLALGSLASEPLSGTGVRWQLGPALRIGLGEAWLLGAASAGATRFRAQGLTVFETDTVATLGAGYRFAWNPVTPLIGGFASPRVVSQRFVRDDEATVMRVLRVGEIQSRASFGLTLGAVAGLEAPLPWNLVLLGLVRFEVRYLPALDQSWWTIGVSGDVGIGWRF
ncbi:MAG: hypothetical protein GQE15_02135 [Archangiaceae bacterium]|nr:hypothetical protein [Archangiaceae bacterium]